MMNNSPSIIFNCQFQDYGSDDEKNHFYRCRNKDSNIIDYMDRKNASDKLDDKEIEKIKSFIEDTNVTGKSIIGYAKNREGSTGIFSKDASDTPENLSEKLKKTGSIIWHSVLSFTPEVSSKFCSNKADAEKLIRATFPKFFKKNKSLDYDNIDWFGAYHTNTDNRHIHLVFWEKTPQNIDSYGNKNYATHGKIPVENFTIFKWSVEKYFHKNKLEFFSVRDEVRQMVTSVAKNNKSFFNSLVEKGASIIQDGHFQYARLKPEEKKTIDSFLKVIFSNHKEIKNKYDGYKKDLLNAQATFIKMHNDLHTTKIPKETLNYYSTRKKDLDSRLSNALLGQLKEYAIKKNELEQSVGYVNGKWSPSKLSPKNRKAIVSRGLSKLANSAMKTFISHSADEIDSFRAMTDEEYRNTLKAQGKDIIYE